MKKRDDLRKLKLNKFEFQQLCNENQDFLVVSGRIRGDKATYELVISGGVPKLQRKKATVREKNVDKKEVAELQKFSLQKGEFLILTGKKMKVGDFFYGTGLIDGEIIDFAVKVKNVKNMDLYQKILDEDGNVGYNI